MGLVSQKCSWCQKQVCRSRGRVNEAKKFGWRTYCSLTCQSKARIKQKTIYCSRPGCDAVFQRTPYDSRGSKLYCSRSCAVTINNSKFPKRKAAINQCPCCRKNFRGSQIYCSLECKNKSQIINAKEVCNKIKEFYEKYGRIPLKREFSHYNAARDRFGSWNKAISSAGFTPNPVKFSNKCIAKDGHICDSVAEKIIDDWLSGKSIKHERNIKYPNNPKLTADFVTKRFWIEFFGLSGELREYDTLIKKKRQITKKYKLPLVAIYPKDLFPINRLADILQ